MSQTTADTWYKRINGFSLLRQWKPSNLPTRLCDESKMTDELTVLLFCDIHIDKGATLNLLQCLCVICGCRAIQTNSAETPLALLYMCSYCYNIISSSPPLVFLECTSNFFIVVSYSGMSIVEWLLWLSIIFATC